MKICGYYNKERDNGRFIHQMSIKNKQNNPIKQ